MHQYSQAWFDFRGKRDRYADYFQNSAIATDVHRRFCIELGKQFPDYSDDLWGITASDSEKDMWFGVGLRPWAPSTAPWFRAPPAVRCPFFRSRRCGCCAISGIAIPTAWCTYGFVNAFNPLKNWYDSDVVAIDTGITMLMAENARTGFIWETFMKNPEAARGMQRAGFRTYYQPPGNQKPGPPSSAGSPGNSARGFANRLEVWRGRLMLRWT